MIPSTLFVFVAAISSLVAVNGAVVQRDGTFTSLMPKSTSPCTTTSTCMPPSPTCSPMCTTPPPPCTTMCPPQTTGCMPPMTTPCPTPGSGPGTANCNGVQEWQAAFAYNAGDKVIFNNQLFTAKQWTFNNAPSTHPDQWIAGGVCAQPINNKANCNGVAAWQKTVAYVAGSKVTFNGHLWSAVQWTESNAPGDASGSWQDLGACA